MREILFRGKKIYDGKWAFSHNPIGTMLAGMLHYDFDPATVGQWTGLTDKNGVKIFEGDIIKWDPRGWGDEYSEAVAWNEVVTWDYELFTMRRHDWPQFCEVIGNIYDNPELLGAAE